MGDHDRNSALLLASRSDQSRALVEQCRALRQRAAETVAMSRRLREQTMALAVCYAEWLRATDRVPADGQRNTDGVKKTLLSSPRGPTRT